MRRFLLAAAAVATLAVGSAAKAATPVQVVGWDHHHHVIVDRCDRREVRYVQPEYVYGPRVIAARPVVVAPAPYPAPYPTYYPGNFITLGGRNFNVQFGW